MKRNAYFQLIHESDGMYLQSFLPEDGGNPLSADDILRYLENKKYLMVEPMAVKTFVEEAAKTEHARLKVNGNPNSLPEMESVEITLDRKRYMAKIRMYPPSSQGQRLSIKDIYSLLEQHNVKHGILKKNLELLWHSKLYCTDILIAKATMPVQGTDAFIDYLFDYEKTSTPTMNEDGSVDFHKLDMIERVQEGQCVAKLTPEIPGKPGTDVTGAAIAPAKVQKKTLKHGRNLHLSEDKLELYSDVSGDITLVDETVFVSNVYDVPADVGPSTGDIEYDGSVVVKGTVLTGYRVVAAGDITVHGAVEGAILQAGGKIVLKNGVQGMGKAQLEAQGDVISNFIESATVKAGGKVIADAIMHSQVEAQNVIQVEGKKGLITGGRVRSTLSISTKTAGSTMGTQTELEVGLDPTVLDRYHSIEQEMEALSNERDTLLQNIQILKRRLKATGRLEDDKKMKLKTSAQRIQTISDTMVQLTEEYDLLEQELESQDGAGRIVVHGITYPGVKLTISNVSTFVHKETKYSAYVREGADIRITAI